jgi:glycosyltransferase involved in cell wall biosynthesis
MKTKPKCSIIIRTFNEERWISKCLNAIYDQTYKNFEVIIVDNLSKDKTISRAKEFNVEKIVEIKDYLPGKALNLGIRESEGDYIVMISSHCIPVDKFWLENLVNTLEEDSDYAGVYGRQEPMSFSSASTKRDLMLVFGLDPKIQIRDGFFHNANSIIKKKIWNKYPFDEETTNIEDRLWGQEMVHNNFKLKYEPEASVYHYHGIHQDGNESRLSNIVKIIHEKGKDFKVGKIDIDQLKIFCIIPVRKLTKSLFGKRQLDFTLDHANCSKYIEKTFVSSSDKKLLSYVKELGVKVIKRSKDLDGESVSTDAVLKDALEQVEYEYGIPDLIVYLEETFPFRDVDLIDKMIISIIHKGNDSIIASFREPGLIFHEHSLDNFKSVDSGNVPRKFKENNYVAIKGICCVTHPENVREGSLLGKDVGLFHVDNLLSRIEVRDDFDPEKHFNPK